MSRKKWELDRRTFVKGLGLSIGLPLLDAMIPSIARASASKTQRLVWIYVSNGLGSVQNGASIYDLPTKVAATLSPIKGDMTLIRNLNSPRDTSLGSLGDAHTDSLTAFVNGGLPGKEISDYSKTFDQYIADVNLGSKQRSVGMVGSTIDNDNFVYTTLSIKSKGQRVPYYLDPQALFSDLFSDSSTVTQVDQRKIDQLNRRRGFLHYAVDEIKKIQSNVGQDDKIRLDEYFSGLNDLDRKITSELASTPTATMICDKPSIGTEFGEYNIRLQLMYDIAYFALKCDLTRVVTLMHSREGSDVHHRPFLSGLHSDASWHGLSHVSPPGYQESSLSEAENQADIESVVAWHFTKIVNFVSRLKGTALPNGQTLLDECGVVWGSSMAHGGHANNGLNMCVAGGANGALKMGQTINANGALMSNLWLTLLQSYGVQMTSFGTSNGTISGLRV